MSQNFSYTVGGIFVLCVSSEWEGGGILRVLKWHLYSTNLGPYAGSPFEIGALHNEGPLCGSPVRHWGLYCGPYLREPPCEKQSTSMMGLRHSEYPTSCGRLGGSCCLLRFVILCIVSLYMHQRVYAVCMFLYVYIYTYIYIWRGVCKFGCRVILEAIFHGTSFSSVEKYALNPKPLAHSHVLDGNSLTLQPGDVVFHPL